MKKSLGARLKELRGKLNQTQMANVFTLSGQAWSSYECDAKEPTLSTICRICQHFNVSAGWLLGLEEKETTLPEGSFKYPGRSATEAYVDSKVAESRSNCHLCSAKDIIIANQSATLKDQAEALKMAMTQGRSEPARPRGSAPVKY